MATGEGDWEHVPSYTELLDCLYDYVSELPKAKPSFQSLEGFNFSSSDVLLIAFISSALIIIRYVLTEACFKRLVSCYNLTPNNRYKVLQYLWYVVHYSFNTTLSLYVVVFSGRYRFFQRPSTVWTGWSLSEPVPRDIYWLYMSQISFLISSLYAIAFTDAWRKDSVLYIFHHVVGITLLSVSYSMRTHKIGSLTLLLHDVSEAPLEFAKLNGLLRAPGRERLHEILAAIGFVCFSVIWFPFRLYYFPLKGIYISMRGPAKDGHPLFMLLIALLWLIQAFNIYWSLFIVALAVRIVTGKQKRLADPLDFKDDVTRKKSHDDVADVSLLANEKDHEIRLRGRQRTHR